MERINQLKNHLEQLNAQNIQLAGELQRIKGYRHGNQESTISQEIRLQEQLTAVKVEKVALQKELLQLELQFEATRLGVTKEYLREEMKKY